MPIEHQESGNPASVEAQLMEARQELAEKIKSAIEDLEATSPIVKLYIAFHSPSVIGRLQDPFPEAFDHPDMKIWSQAKKKLEQFSRTGSFEETRMV